MKLNRILNIGLSLGVLFFIPLKIIASENEFSVGYFDLFPLSPQGASGVTASPVPLKNNAWLDLLFQGSQLTGEHPIFSSSFYFPVGEFSHMGFSYGQDGNLKGAQRNLAGIFTLRPLKGLTWGIGFKTLEKDSEYFTQFEGAGAYDFDYSNRGAISYKRSESNYQLLGEYFYKGYKEAVFNPLLKTEFGLNNGALKTWPLSLGLGFELGKEKSFELMTKVYKGNDGFNEFLFGGGILLRQYYKSTEVCINYGVLHIDPNNTSLMAHGAGISFSFGASDDYAPPQMVVRLEKTSLSSDSLDQSPFRFIIDAKDNSGKISKWVLMISEITEGAEIKGVFHSIRGEGQPPRYIEWQGQSINHKESKKGKYAYRFLSTDALGNTAASDWQYLEIL